VQKHFHCVFVLVVEKSNSFCPSLHEREEFLATLVDRITLADPHFIFGVDLRLVANEHSHCVKFVRRLQPSHLTLFPWETANRREWSA
jgi:hypothetical protein